MRKLSFEENLRHRLRDMKRIGHRKTSSSGEGLLYLSIGAAVGIAAGIVLAQKYGGLSAITSRMSERLSRHKLDETEDASQDAEQRAARRERAHLEGYDAHDYAQDVDTLEDQDHDEALTATEALEERVLEAYRNDPILSERAIDIGALDIGIVELTGWVHSAAESKHAVTIARGTPGVETVLNRLAVRDEDEWFGQRAARYSETEPTRAPGQWTQPSAPREAPSAAPRAD